MLLALGCGGGKAERDGGAFSDFARDIDRPSRPMGEAVGLAEAEPAPLAHVLGGEERLEYPLLECLRDADARVREADGDDALVQAGLFVAKRLGPGLHGQDAAAGHGVARVEADVEDRELEL